MYSLLHYNPRHAIWNVLICKYIGEDKNAISDCTERAEDFTTKHETGADKPITMTDAAWALDQQMDLHNNAQGRKYFESVAPSSWICPSLNKQKILSGWCVPRLRD
jgi:hypothetical protein